MSTKHTCKPEYIGTVSYCKVKSLDPHDVCKTEYVLKEHVRNNPILCLEPA
jgi:hypothetical protein